MSQIPRVTRLRFAIFDLVYSTRIYCCQKMKNRTDDNDRLPMPSFLLINTSLRPTHVPPLQPLLPLVLVTTLIAQRRYPRPYTYPTPTVHHQPIIVKIHDISTNTPPKLIPMGTTATTRWRPFTLCLWLGSNVSGLGCRGCLALLRYFFYTNRRNFYTRMR